jgi:hypothetical protein
MREYPARASFAVGSHDMNGRRMGDPVTDQGVGTMNPVVVDLFVVKRLAFEKLEKGGDHLP